MYSIFEKDLYFDFGSCAKSESGIFIKAENGLCE